MNGGLSPKLIETLLSVKSCKEVDYKGDDASTVSRTMRLADIGLQVKVSEMVMTKELLIVKAGVLGSGYPFDASAIQTMIGQQFTLVGQTRASRA